MASKITFNSTVWVIHQRPASRTLCQGEPPVTSGFPSQRVSNAKNVSMSWRLHNVEIDRFHNNSHFVIYQTCKLCGYLFYEFHHAYDNDITNDIKLEVWNYWMYKLSFTNLFQLVGVYIANVLDGKISTVKYYSNNSVNQPLFSKPTLLFVGQIPWKSWNLKKKKPSKLMWVNMWNKWMSVWTNMTHQAHT